MSEASGFTKSVWMSSAAVPGYPPLESDAETDVVIVGAGISGLTTAYLLGQEGVKTIVLDDGPIVSGESARTTAHLASAMDDRYFELERLHGLRGARLAAESHSAAIDEIERIIAAEGISCDFTRLDGFLFPALAADAEMLSRELAAALRAGLRGVEAVKSVPIPTFQTGGALRFARQGQFHPLKYLAGMARAITRDGGRIFAQTHVNEISGGKSAFVRTATGARVTAKAVVVATNSPVNDRVTIHTKQAPYRTYVIAAAIPAGSVPTALYWDTADPYHYIRVQADLAGEGHDTLIVGGEDHKTGQAFDAETRWARLEMWTRERFAISRVTHRWSGQVIEPVDYLAYIGRNPGEANNLYVATGDSGQGMTHGTIAGMLLRDLIVGRPNPWAELYSPARISPGSADEFIRENTNMAAQYTDWLTPGDVNAKERIPAGEGAIVRHGMSKVAVFRDESGELHECSATCPHLGGIVKWNSAEKTWDCPVHGSRFDCFGKVVNGPAITDLTPLRARQTVNEREPSRG